ncbi:MAG: hypothetical protein IIU19_03320, partial [Oscillospiraceae bacterium]|nr:hypothetical protein [Oscillospiraceae bacterium]
YDLDEQDRVSMSLIPASMRDRTLRKEYHPEPLLQIHARGDQLPNGYGNGQTTATTPASDALKLVSQQKEENTIITTVSDGSGRTVHHKVRWEKGLQAVVVSAVFENTGDRR